jgi:type II secretory pathway pseudopilin PulG
MNLFSRERKGISIIETLIVVALIAIFGMVSLTNLLGRRGTNEFNGTVKQMGALLREAQSRAMSQASGTTWGVHFSNATSGAFFALFAGPSYSTSTQRGYYKMPQTMAYTTSTIASGATKTVTFTQITGFTASTTIGLYSLRTASLSSTISIASSGAVAY